ncbi:MinD/ParA family protein [Paenibacillus sp. OV219]|uniref:MinD/ParA family protein n=1 Tax=Paenibacillus sp. OV219 TaxID=1884377 RepID=UPI0008D74FA0|nr:MinD/ParA family protein [Paenibacillus sp. OV219]SEN32668.1 flagellar biosynthesis protein FlhG [Paenibacillus sp. OV219]
MINNDQAEALRNLVRNNATMREEGRATRIVTVTSGKGGVGKSNFSLNFCLALQQLGKKVLIFDADIGMANIDVLMGVSSPYNLYHLLKQEKTIWDIIQEGPHGVHFIAGGSGFKDLVDLSSAQLDYFAEQIGRLHGEYDVILFDTGAGLSKETIKFITAAQETIIVTTPEPTSITDAYALIKMVTAMEHDVKFKLIVNRATDAKEGKATADKMALVAQRFLNLELPVLGYLPDDPNVPKSVKKQVPFSIAFPGTVASKTIMDIAKQFADVPGVSGATSNGVKGFLHKMFRLSK